ncbi:hypothetical protein AXE80_06260 [Wenyingzhuangia fucanilytica]|uniref:Secretion system C-terminal sorting domain-containing protein n=2 Tax=Wenyingzhuangia fucanilytica TaxID=1790137 RepID=A0A1B1Y566_9FLAO|nr:hypothetical protein AXE80_06260 [Wenyingzhuangia fucanilytica]
MELPYTPDIVRYHHQKMFLVDTDKVLHVYENGDEILTLDVNLHPDNDNNNVITDISFNGNYFGLLYKHVAYFYDLTGTQKFQIGQTDSYGVDHPTKFNRGRALLITNQYVYIRTRNRVSAWKLEDVINSTAQNLPVKYAYSEALTGNGSNNYDRDVFAQKGDVIYLTERSSSKIHTFKESEITEDTIPLTALNIEVNNPEYGAFIGEFYGVFSKNNVAVFFDLENNSNPNPLTDTNGFGNYFTTENYFYYQSSENSKVFKSIRPNKKNIYIAEENTDIATKLYAQKDLSYYKLLNDKELRNTTAKHYIKTKELIEVVAHENYIKVNNWLAKDYYNVHLVGKVDNYQFNIGVIDTLKGLTAYFIPKPWKAKNFKSNGVNLSNNTNVSLDFSEVSEQNINDFELNYLALDNENLQRLKQVTVDWKLQFYDRVLTGDKDICGGTIPWNTHRPLELRYLLTLMENGAYMVSKPLFQEDWLKTSFNNFSDNNIPDEDRVLQAELDNYSEEEKSIWESNGWTVDTKHIYNKAHRAKILEKYKTKTFNLGITGGGGLGGGATLGLDNKNFVGKLFNYEPAFVELYEKNQRYYLLSDSTISSKGDTPWNLTAHEIGHTLGFSHGSSYCVRSNNSHVLLSNIHHSYMVSQNDLLVLKNEMTGRSLALEANNSGDANILARGRCRTPAEFGGAWGLHNIELPSDRTSPEFQEYLVQNAIGKGLEYLKTLDINQGYHYAAGHEPYEITSFEIKDETLNITNDYLFDGIEIPTDTLKTNNSEENSQGITVSPTPTDGILTISGIDSIKTLNIIDITGRACQFTRTSNNQLDISNLRTGVYFLIVNNTTSIKIYKY